MSPQTKNPQSSPKGTLILQHKYDSFICSMKCELEHCKLEVLWVFFFFKFIYHSSTIKKNVLGAQSRIDKHFKLQKKRFADSFVQCPKQTSIHMQCHHYILSMWKKILWSIVVDQQLFFFYTLITNALRNTKWNCKGQVVSHRPPFCSEVLENGNPSGEYCYP